MAGLSKPSQVDMWAGLLQLAPDPAQMRSLLQQPHSGRCLTMPLEQLGRMSEPFVHQSLLTQASAA
eukprot:3847198-Alexandrium_andersonii.AAC.1